VTPAELSRAVLSTVRRAVAAEELRVAVPEKVVVQRPPRPGCGDYATNVALQLAGSAGRTPYAVAEILARRLEKEPGIAQVEIAGRGFLNITLSARAYGDVVRQVRAQRAEYGCGDLFADEVVTVAAEPGSARGEVVAEVVNRLFRAAGAQPSPGAPTEMLIVQEPAVPAPPLGPAPTPGPQPAAPLGPAPRPSAQRARPLGQAPRTAAPLGPDATRWALLRPPVEDAPRLTADLLDQRESNPLFRIRYAHSRARALLRNARDLGVEVEAAEDQDAPPYHHPAETELLGLIADYPRVVETAARRRAPDRVARHMERLADAFFRFHDECPPLPKGDEKPSAAHAARIRLADATGVVLAGGLNLLGISAPEQM
jgi:arginyl-tRNA synthetase